MPNILFLVCLTALLAALAYATVRTGQLLRTWTPDRNLMLSGPENVFRLALIAVCLLLGLTLGPGSAALGLRSTQPVADVALGLACGLVLAYETDDTRVLFFLGFRKNNKIQYNKEGASQFPPPPGYHRTDDGLEEDAPAPNSRPTLELVQSNARPTPELPTVKLTEEKRRETSPAAGDDDGSLPLDPAFGRVCAAYHANIGVTTKIISDQLKDDLATYGADWIVEAIGIATKAEKRNLSYVEGILKRWRTEGKTNGRNGTGAAADPYKGAREIK